MHPDKLFQDWTREAYSAYALPVPPSNVGILPTLLKTVPNGSPASQRVYRANATSSRPVPSRKAIAPEPLRPNEAQFIKEHYGLTL
ncbi:MAG: hypothetical protein CR991_08705 [Proteobacteria bacterium]|nr:MAG: hypothetical protein CR991_08705 [Pseudomonadota bacterium]